MESIQIGQGIVDRKEEEIGYFNLLNNFKIGISLFVCYIFVCFAILSTAFFIKELSYRIRFERRRFAKISKRIVSAVSSFGVKRLSAISLFALFVHLFLWFSELFLTNNIKTNKVVRSFQSKLTNLFEAGNFRIIDDVFYLFRWSTLIIWSRT